MSKVKKKRGSLKTKWAIYAAVFVGVLFLFYTVVTFFILQNAMVDNIYSYTQEITAKTSYVLAESDSELTESNVSDKLDPMFFQDNYVLGYRPDIDYLAETVHNGYDVQVFDADKSIVYSALEQPLDSFKVPDHSDTFFMAVEGSGYSVISSTPIYSRHHGRLIGYLQVVNHLQQFEHLVLNLVRSFFITALVTLVIGAIAGYFLAKVFVKPINGLIRSMNQVLVEPYSNKRIEVDQVEDELDSMAITYNQMLDLMQKNVENQKQFVEDVSHELRTPVQVVEGYLRMLERWGKDDPEILDEAITNSTQELGRMKRLIEQMLELSRSNNLESITDLESTNLTSLVRRVYANYKVMHPSVNYELSINTSKKNLYLEIPNDNLEQILVVLLDNAIKYSGEDKQIKIIVEDLEDSIEIKIIDNGFGIPEDDLNNIFNRFYRVDKARSREKGGNGLGLSIAYQLVDQYGGQIEVDSKVDVGTSFVIKFPINS